ncbi:MAG: bZIP transcription factor [Bacillota bacterium]|nr:bZIP transcription factor [Bacillota bacterium]MDW7676316.1 bZIP transcription factor [Bacillota bacterium]
MKKTNRCLLPAFLLSLILLLTSCSPAANGSETGTPPADEEFTALQKKVEALEAANETLNEEAALLQAKLTELEQQLSIPGSGSLLSTAISVVELIADGDFEAVAEIAHPTEGVRFSPYGYVNVADDILFTVVELNAIMQSSQVYTWGAFDGTGDPIDKNFSDYYDRFIYDADFSNPEIIGNNTIVGSGNTLINLADVYPSGSFVEFHFTGFDPQYEGMDWRSLRLVFQEDAGQWKLVGIVHDEWTI